jgi:hypothetical protein
MPSIRGCVRRAWAASSVSVASGTAVSRRFVDKPRRGGAYFALAGAEVAELADAHV